MFQGHYSLNGRDLSKHSFVKILQNWEAEDIGERLIPEHIEEAKDIVLSVHPNSAVQQKMIFFFHASMHKEKGWFLDY